MSANTNSQQTPVILPGTSEITPNTSDTTYTPMNQKEPDNLLDEFLAQTHKPIRACLFGPSEKGKTTILTGMIGSYLRYHPEQKVNANYRIFNRAYTREEISDPKIYKEPHPRWKPFSNFRTAKNLSNELLVIDEISKYVSSYNWGTNQNRLYTELAANLRKQGEEGVSFFASDQGVTTVDKNIRRNFELWIKPDLNGEITLTFYESWEQALQDDPIEVYELNRFEKQAILSYASASGSNIGRLAMRLNQPLQLIVDPKDIWGYFDTKQIIPSVKDKRDIKKEWIAFKKWTEKTQLGLKGTSKIALREWLALYDSTSENTTGWPLSTNDKEAIIALARMEGFLD